MLNVTLGHLEKICKKEKKKKKERNKENKRKNHFGLQRKKT